jgi:hypothetical protein
MNLSELRTQFIEMCGRDDLVNSDGSDNGADFYINEGQRFLDRRIDFGKSTGVVFKNLSINSWYIYLEDCRAVTDVWVQDTEERWLLEKKDLKWLYEEYPDTIAETDSGDPAYWAIANVRGLDLRAATTLGTFFSFVMSQRSSEGVTGIVIMPPTDTALVVEVWGKFYSPRLLQDADSTWWSREQEFLLLNSALYHLEIAYRNTEGARDWLAAMDLALIDVDKDSVFEDNANVDGLEG